MKEITSKTLAKHIAKSALELKAEDIKVLSLSGLSSFTDFFVICSGTSDRHVQSIADRIVIDQKKDGHANFGVEGLEKGDWVLIDFGGVVAHVFHPKTREFYGIEKLWGDASEVKYKGITT